MNNRIYHRVTNFGPCVCMYIYNICIHYISLYLVTKGITFHLCSSNLLPIGLSAMMRSPISPILESLEATITLMIVYHNTYPIKSPLNPNTHCSLWVFPPWQRKAMYNRAWYPHTNPRCRFVLYVRHDQNVHHLEYACHYYYVFWSPYKSQIAHIQYKVYIHLSHHILMCIYIFLTCLYLSIFILFTSNILSHLIIYMYILLSIIIPLLYQCCFAPSWRSTFSSRILIWAQGVHGVDELYQLKTLGLPPGSGTFNQGKWGKPAKKGDLSVDGRKIYRDISGDI